MEYRALGRTGVQVSELCLGCMMFGRRTGAEDSYGIIDRALDAGINFLDTANVYGRGASETAWGGILGYTFDHAAEVLQAYAHASEHAPDTLALYAALMTAPPLPFILERLHGQPAAALLAFCFGTADEHPERAVAAVRALLPPPAADATGPMTYLGTQRMGEGIAPEGMHHGETAEWLRLLDDTAIKALVSAAAEATSPQSAIKALVTAAAEATSPRSAISIKGMGGATARVPAGQTAGPPRPRDGAGRSA